MLERINSFVWGNGLVLLLLFTGILYTLKLRFIQFRAIPFVLRSAFSENKNSNRGLSQWKTVCMSLGTAMGTGNITGVAAASCNRRSRFYFLDVGLGFSRYGSCLFRKLTVSQVQYR